MTHKEKDDFLAQRRRRTANKASSASTSAQEQPIITTDNQGAEPTSASEAQLAPGSELRHLLSNTSARTPQNVATAPSTLSFQGMTNRACNNANVKYHTSKAITTTHYSSLIDGGCNGGLAGEDMLILATSTTRFTDVTSISNNDIPNIPIVTGTSKIYTTDGPAIAIFNEYTNMGKGTTIHSVRQLSHFGLDVNNKSNKLPGGKQ